MNDQMYANVLFYLKKKDGGKTPFYPPEMSKEQKRAIRDAATSCYVGNNDEGSQIIYKIVDNEAKILVFCS